jgi:hypothetical protein
MSDSPITHTGAAPVDELWLADWAAEGIAAFERLLARHAAFAAFLADRGLLDSPHGDGDARR